MLTAARWLAAAAAMAGVVCLLLYLAVVHVDVATALARPGTGYFALGLAAGSAAGFAAWRGAGWGLAAVAGAAGLDVGLAYVSAATLGPLVIVGAALNAAAAAGFVAGDRLSGGRLASTLLLVPVGLALGLVPLLLPR